MPSAKESSSRGVGAEPHALVVAGQLTVRADELEADRAAPRRPGEPDLGQPVAVVEQHEGRVLHGVPGVAQRADGRLDGRRLAEHGAQLVEDVRAVVEQDAAAGERRVRCATPEPSWGCPGWPPCAAPRTRRGARGRCAAAAASPPATAASGGTGGRARTRRRRRAPRRRSPRRRPGRARSASRTARGRRARRRPPTSRRCVKGGVQTSTKSSGSLASSSSAFSYEPRAGEDSRGRGAVLWREVRDGDDLDVARELAGPLRGVPAQRDVAGPEQGAPQPHRQLPSRASSANASSRMPSATSAVPSSIVSGGFTRNDGL